MSTQVQITYLFLVVVEKPSLINNFLVRGEESGHLPLLFKTSFDFFLITSPWFLPLKTFLIVITGPLYGVGQVSPFLEASTVPSTSGGPFVFTASSLPGAQNLGWSTCSGSNLRSSHRSCPQTLSEFPRLHGALRADPSPVVSFPGKAGGLSHWEQGFPQQSQIGNDNLFSLGSVLPMSQKQ